MLPIYLGCHSRSSTVVAIMFSTNMECSFQIWTKKAINVLPLSLDSTFNQHHDGSLMRSRKCIPFCGTQVYIGISAACSIFCVYLLDLLWSIIWFLYCPLGVSNVLFKRSEFRKQIFIFVTIISKQNMNFKQQINKVRGWSLDFEGKREGGFEKLFK